MNDSEQAAKDSMEKARQSVRARLLVTHEPDMGHESKVVDAENEQEILHDGIRDTVTGAYKIHKGLSRAASLRSTGPEIIYPLELLEVGECIILDTLPAYNAAKTRASSIKKKTGKDFQSTKSKVTAGGCLWRVA